MKLISRKKKKKLLTLYEKSIFLRHSMHICLFFHSFYTHINKCNELETITKCNCIRNSHSLQFKGNSIANILLFHSFAFYFFSKHQDTVYVVHIASAFLSRFSLIQKQKPHRNWKCWEETYQNDKFSSNRLTFSGTLCVQFILK